MTAADWVWYDESGAGRIARALLAPASWAYAGVVAVRGTLYDRGVLPASTSAIPVLSLGNQIGRAHV